MAMVKVFHNHVKNCKVVHPDGRIIQFFNGKHMTAIKVDVDYLESLIEAGDQFVFVDPDELEIDTEELTEAGRIKKLKREAVEEFLREQEAKKDRVTESMQGALNPGTTATLVNALESNGQLVEGAKGDAPVVAGTGVKVSAPGSAPASK